MLDWFPWPHLSDSLLTLFRSATGVLTFWSLALTLPHARRFFQSERYGGYGESSPYVDCIQNPVVLPLVWAAWMCSCLCLVFGVGGMIPVLFNLACAHYFHIQMRWRGVVRGMGAPGFLTYWLAAAVAIMEFGRLHAPQLLPLGVLVLQVDFALIMLSAGLYKSTAGYLFNDGMECGMVNPMWGYLHRFYSRFKPQGLLFWVFNQLAWGTEVVAAILMLIPQTRWLGGLAIAMSFVYIGVTIRLLVLCPMVILGCFVFFTTADPAGALIGGSLVTAPAAGAAPAWLTWAVGCFLTAYLILLPLSHAGLFYNFYSGKAFWTPLQGALEAWTNAFGIIIWRVFSFDHTSFYVNVYRQEADGSRTLLSNYDTVGSRFNHVGECITVTSLFTTLKYYPSNNEIFQQRVLRYARTLPCPAGTSLVFEYVSIRKEGGEFSHLPAALFFVDPHAGTVREEELCGTVSIRGAAGHSPLREGVRPGSYVSMRG